MSRKSKALEFVNDTYTINVTGRNVQVTEPMKNYAVEKISKIERFSHRIIDVVVTMDIQKLDHRVDIVLKVDHVKIKSSAVTNDMYASVDLAVDRLLERLRRYKTRINDHQARGVKSIDLRVNVIEPHAKDDVEDVNEEIEKENQRQLIKQYRHKVIREKTLPLKSLNLDEAMMKMELTDDAFLLFRSEEDQKLKVIYRRPQDGHFGVIEPEL